MATQGRSDFEIRAGVLSKAFGDRDYLLRSDFSGADILVGLSCFMATVTELIGDYLVLEAFSDRCISGFYGV